MKIDFRVVKIDFSCYLRIKYTTATFLAALMWRRHLNSFSTTTAYRKPEKLLKYDRDSSIGLDGKQVDDGKWIGRDYIIGETPHK